MCSAKTLLTQNGLPVPSVTVLVGLWGREGLTSAAQTMRSGYGNRSPSPPQRPTLIVT